MMLFLLLVGCLYDKDHLDWVYTQLEDDDGDGYREIDGDCDDSSSAVHPEVDEICDGLDNDCNGDADGDALDIRAWFQDRDQDGYGNDDVSRLSCDPVPTYSEENGDCDDDDADVHPDAEVICGEPGDRNCDGVPEDEDLDQDGWARCEDCDDLERKVNPGEVEVCNEYDDNCDGQIDEVGALETTWYPDADGDGYGDPEGAVVSCARPQGYTFDGGDCDDHDNDINPGELEVCGNGADDNCNGAADGCRLEGELEVGASFVGAGIGWVQTLFPFYVAGDMDGDGASEVMFGGDGTIIVHQSPYNSGEQAIDRDYRLRLTGPVGVFGRVNSPVGDVTGDGLADIAVEDLMAVNSLGGRGLVYILDETMQGDLTTEDLPQSALLEMPFNQLGLGVKAGNVGENGPQLLVSSWEDFDGANLPSYSITYGITLPLTPASMGAPEELVRTASNSQHIIAPLEATSDFNGDGQCDLLAYYGAFDRNEPKIGIFWGPVANRQESDVDVEISGDFSSFGYEVVGDVDGDGDLDVGVSSPWDINRTDDGKVWLIDVQQSGDYTSRSVAEVTGGTVDDVVLSGVVKDLDGDGTADLVLGFALAEVDYRYQGWAGLFYGPFTGSRAASSRDAAILGSAESSEAGYLINSGDLNGNGVMDLLVGFRETSEAESHIDVFFDGL